MAVQPWAGALAVVLLSVAAWIFVTTSPARDFGVGRYFCCAGTLCRHDRLPDGMGSGSGMHEYFAGFPTEAVHMMRTSISAGRQANESGLVVVMGASLARFPYAVNYYADLVVPLSARLLAVEANPDLLPRLERRLGELGVDPSRTTIVNAVVGEEGEQLSFATVPGYDNLGTADKANMGKMGVPPGYERDVLVPGISTRDLLERARARPSDVSMLTIDFIEDGWLLSQLFELPGFAPSVVLHHTLERIHKVVVTQFLVDRGYDVTDYGMYAVAIAASSAAVEFCERERSSPVVRGL
uniref:Methyltransferase FkbM domain-containing protein n=1 Tax=Alexandrium catenella TaxID=2925 RepID=A0A7S1R9B6_ALECA|mmetsp:Transcript_48894/g.130882  ORF Transcript_48894/g.130882 Transcript_48894/m.130882 type:complete len:297 (-) Transcript_48894:116-1006(-)